MSSADVVEILSDARLTFSALSLSSQLMERGFEGSNFDIHYQWKLRWAPMYILKNITHLNCQD